MKGVIVVLKNRRISPIRVRERMFHDLEIGQIQKLNAYSNSAS